MKKFLPALVAAFLSVGIISATCAADAPAPAPAADAAAASSSSAAAAAEADALAAAQAAAQGIGIAAGGAGGRGGAGGSVAPITVTGGSGAPVSLTGGPTTVATTNSSTTTNKTKFLYVSQPTVPAVAPTVVGTGSTVVTSQCGPLLNKVRAPIEYLLVGHTSEKLTIVGQNTDDVVPYRELVTDDNGNPVMVPVIGPDGKAVTETVIGLDGKKKVQTKMVQKGGPVIKWDEVYEGNGVFVQYGSIYSEAAIVVTMSVSKQWLFNLFGSSSGGGASSGISGTITGTQRIIALGRCEYRRYKVVVEGTKVAQVPAGGAVTKAAPAQAPAPQLAPAPVDAVQKENENLKRVVEQQKQVIEGLTKGKTSAVKAPASQANPQGTGSAKAPTTQTKPSGK